METRKLSYGAKKRILNSITEENKLKVTELLNKIKVASDRGCWFLRDDWSDYTTIDGRSAHRFSYQLFNGSIDSKLIVCHRCDRRGCINPAHLYQGTQSDNLQDHILKFKLKKLRKYIIAKESSDEKINAYRNRFR